MKLFPIKNYPSILNKSPREIDSISMVGVDSVNIIISVMCERTLDNCLQWRTKIAYPWMDQILRLEPF